MTMQTNLTLTGEQKLVLALPLREPVLVRGAAGSGKTTVAVYRARHLYESHHDLFRSGRIGLFTYPTDVQAEVLLPAAVPIERICAFAVAGGEHACRLKGLLRVTGAERLCERVKEDPAVFGERSG